MRLAACLIVAIVCSVVPTHAQSIESPDTETLDNEAIVGMTKMGLADDVILARIQEAASVNFRLDTDSLVSLKDAGVKPKIIVAMITRAAAPPKSNLTEESPDPAAQEGQPKSDRPHGTFGIVLGMKILENGWQQVDNQFEFGLIVSVGRDNWPIDIAVDFLSSEDSLGGCGYGAIFCTSPETLGRTFELDAGARKIWETGKVLPYMGAGIGGIRGEFRSNAGPVHTDSHDLALGWWAGMGLLYRPIKVLEFGLDVRYSSADVDLNFGAGAQSVNAGGFHFGLLFGGYF